MEEAEKTILFPTHEPSLYLNVRPGRKDDMDVMREIWCEDVYHIHDRVSEVKFVVDLGANIGAFTCFILKNAEKANVMAIEPEPHNLRLLKSNIARLDSNRVIIKEVAIADYVGESTIEDNAGGSILGGAGSNVKVERIDNLLPTKEKSSDIDIFKIDIEGSEVAVLLDMSLELQRRVKFFAIEYDDKNNGEGLGKVVEKLTETHQVRTLGAASRGAMIYAERY